MKTGSSQATAISSAPTINDLIGRFERSNRAEGKSPKTIAWYTDMLKLFSTYTKAHFISCDITCLTVDNVRQYILHLRNRNRFEGHPYTPEQDQLLSPRTVQCHVRALKAFATWLYTEGYTTANILKNLKLPKAPVTLIEPLTPGEIETVSASISRDSATSIRNHAILVTLLDTGLRASEAASITLSHLNLKDGYIKVMGKGAKERIVPIGKFVQMILWSYIDRVRPMVALRERDNLFLSPAGMPITANTVKLVFSRLAKKSGVGRLHAHLCRHTFAINYLLNGGDIFSLREILGHSSLDMVNHYLHFTSSQITDQHRKYSPMDKFHNEQRKAEKRSTPSFN